MQLNLKHFDEIHVQKIIRKDTDKVLDEMLDIATAVKEFEIPKIPEKCVPLCAESISNYF